MKITKSLYHNKCYQDQSEHESDYRQVLTNIFVANLLSLQLDIRERGNNNTSKFHYTGSKVNLLQ